MRQIKILAFCIGLILIGADTLYAGTVKCPKNNFSQEVKAELQAKVIATYESLVGFKEDLGPNDSKEIRIVLRSVGIKTPAFYCAAFVCWGLTENGICNPKTAWSPSLFPESHTIDLRTTVPEPGDCFGVFHNDLKRIAHAGAVKRWPRDGDTFYSIEGNTNINGGRNGDGFYEKRRPKRTAYKISRWI